jgi:hypothetical protein
MRIVRRLLIALISCGLVVPAARAAPSVRLAIRDGSVWLQADRATAGEILAEWARVGQTRIINGERVPGGPMTLELNGVPEQQALEVVLRSASGFLALARTIARADSSSSMTSRFERILVLPASAAPPSPGALASGPAAAGPAAMVPATAGQVNGQPPAAQIPQMPPGAPGVPVAPGTMSGAPAPQRIIGADGLPLPDDQEDAPPRPPAGAMPPGFVPPPVQPAPGAPPANPAAAGTNPTAPGATPASPAGVPTPGMIVPAPPQPPIVPIPARRRPGDPR